MQHGPPLPIQDVSTNKTMISEVKRTKRTDVTIELSQSVMLETTAIEEVAI